MKMHHTSHFTKIVLLLAATTVIGPLHAQTPSASDPGPVRRWGADAKGYVTAPLHAGRKQWVKFASTVAAVGFAYHYDDEVRAHFVPDPTAPSATNTSHDTQDAIPAALALGGTWLAARLTHSDDGRREAGTMFEAAVFSSVAAGILKRAAGRERPYVSGDHTAFGEGGASFPSGHVTAAFAIGAVLAESGNDRQRWLRRVLGYGMGAVTAYQRMNHDAHWFSDTVAGAGVGIATARFLMKRHDQNDDRVFTIVPTHDGLQLAYMAALHR
jgi:membrane-associated phospholipid phosphatase